MKKFLTFFFSFVFVCTLAPSSFAVTDNQIAFQDVDIYDDYLAAISYLKENNIVKGYEDGSFQPGEKITRDEFAKIIIGSIVSDEELKEYDDNTCFPDVKGYWAVTYVCYAKAKNIIRGNNGFFYPKKFITLPEATKIILKAFEKIENADDTKEDWYIDYLGRGDELNALPPTIQDVFANITRGEMAEMIVRIQNQEKKNDFDSMSYDIEKKKIVPKTYKIESCAELKAKTMVDRPMLYAEGGSLGGVVGGLGAAMMKTTMTNEESASDYSNTNVQVAGVDEADVIKNDGKYIYKIRGNVVDVVHAYPVEEMKSISTIEFEDESFHPQSLYIDEGKLVVLGTYYGEYTIMVDEMSFAPTYDKFQIRIYDMSDPENPKLDRKLNFDGRLNSSRKKGDELYFVIQHNLWYQDDEDINKILPMMSDSKNGDSVKVVTTCSGVQYFPGVENGNLMTIVKISLNNDEINKKSIIGSSENIYMSLDNLYIASTMYNFRHYRSFLRESYVPEVEKTVIHKFSFDDDIKYEGRGKVKGRILNQFAMDQHDENFRIATTIGNVWDFTNKSTSNLYIFNEDMENIGRLEGLAPGERIYSTRFMGDTLYMVTFKKTDPLFVIDISSPTNPTVKGKLKIPGYSDYLHPYDENHLIGFGKDAVSEENEYDKNGEDFVWYQGMKLSLFDVTDLENPKELFTEYIGDRGTESELLHNHKALLFDKSKGLLAFPVRVSMVKNKDDVNANTYGGAVYQGAFVYDLSIENGFELEKKVTHHTGDYKKYNYNNQDNIKRIIYIGDSLYTISDSTIKANNLSTYEALNSVTIKEVEENSNGDKVITY